MCYTLLFIIIRLIYRYFNRTSLGNISKNVSHSFRLILALFNAYFHYICWRHLLKCKIILYFYMDNLNALIHYILIYILVYYIYIYV